ncbi:unnamed protein product [Cylicocyclus nassatus]|uniref:Uncharacterized protein n=1 Tax=Cylicocyclus nassatus TaxID=53992 RepID=A0AA36MCQ2_CYLNA|nr:unnamed protein product [Cylicocyclus nassatus]
MTSLARTSYGDKRKIRPLSLLQFSRNLKAKAEEHNQCTRKAQLGSEDPCALANSSGRKHDANSSRIPSA